MPTTRQQCALGVGFSLFARILTGIGRVWVDMDENNRREMDSPGPFEAGYIAFLETITNLRPSLAPVLLSLDWIGSGR